MADALCGPSNALQTFQKQTSVDRTLQQERFTTRQSPAENFRSAPGPNASTLDAEFEAFQAGQPLQAGYPEPHQVYHGAPASSFQHQPQLLNWALHFQNMHLDEARASPIPQSQFHHHAPPQRTGEWHQDFLAQQNQPSPHQSQQQQTPMDQNYSGWSYGYTGSLVPQYRNTLPPMAQQKQPETQTEDIYDEAAFERAFDAAREEMQQSEESAHREETRLDAGLHDIKAQESEAWTDHSRIGSDRILDEAQERREKGKEADDAEELARTAGQLLENVKGDQSQKFQQSHFLSFMRQLRDKEVRVEGDKLVDSSQPLHPGGSGYPIHHTRPDYQPEDEAHESPVLESSEAMDSPAQSKPIETTIKTPPGPPQQKYHTLQDYQTQLMLLTQKKQQQQSSQALHRYQMQLMLLEQQNKKRLLMARQEQDARGLSQASGQSSDQQAPAIPDQEQQQ